MGELKDKEIVLYEAWGQDEGWHEFKLLGSFDTYMAALECASRVHAKTELAFIRCLNKEGEIVKVVI